MIKKTVSALVLGVVLAQGIIMFTASTANANPEVPPADGSCAPHTNYVCGLNGINYDNKEYKKAD